MPNKQPLTGALLLLLAAGCGGPQYDESLTGAALGEKLFKQCATCHLAVEPGAPGPKVFLAGPNLWGVVDTPAAAVEGFTYSQALRRAELEWDEATLDSFLENPQKVVPGGRMSYPGERNAERRSAIIEYLKTLK